MIKNVVYNLNIVITIAVLKSIMNSIHVLVNKVGKNNNALKHYLTIKINIPTCRECPRGAVHREVRQLQCQEQDSQYQL